MHGMGFDAIPYLHFLHPFLFRRTRGVVVELIFSLLFPSIIPPFLLPLSYRRWMLSLRMDTILRWDISRSRGQNRIFESSFHILSHQLEKRECVWDEETMKHISNSIDESARVHQNLSMLFRNWFFLIKMHKFWKGMSKSVISQVTDWLWNH